jgi:hypothetical protein
MCSDAERANTTIERVVRQVSEGGDEQRMGRMCNMTLERRSNTRRKMACQRLVQKSASVMAVNGASNIGGQLSGWEPNRTKMDDMTV